MKQKIKKVVSAAAMQANLSEEETTQLAGQISNTIAQSTMGREEIPSAEIKEMILNELDTVNPSVAEAWRNYEQGKQQ